MLLLVLSPTSRSSLHRDAPCCATRRRRRRSRCRGCHPTRRWRRTLNPEGVASETRALDQAPVVDPGRFRKLDSGVRVADLKQGSGPEVGDGSRVALQWVLRRSNGYFVDSSLGARGERPGGGTLSLGGDASEDFTPFLFTVGDGKALRGIEDGVRGMRQAAACGASCCR